jgi:DUF4097 and DUF4098 domain-containing protein YvlB
MGRSRMWAFVIASMLPGAVGAQKVVSKKGEAPRTQINVRRAATPTVSVRLVGSFATLRVTAWQHDSVVITGSVPADSRFESASGGRAGEPTQGMKAFLEGAEKGGAAPPAGDIEMRVPERARVWAKAGSAQIEVNGVLGGLDLGVVGGAIRVTGAPSELRADAMDGSITVDGTPAWMRLKTASGDILVRGGSDDAGLSTVSGALNAGEGRYERLRLESVAGAVRFSGDLARGAAVDVDTHGGNVDLLLSPKLAAELDITSIAGRIENEFGGRPPIAGREGRGMEFAITYGGGGSRITVRTFKGTVRVMRR